MINCTKNVFRLPETKFGGIHFFLSLARPILIYLYFPHQVKILLENFTIPLNNFQMEFAKVFDEILFFSVLNSTWRTIFSQDK